MGGGRVTAVTGSAWCVGDVGDGGDHIEGEGIHPTAVSSVAAKAARNAKPEPAERVGVRHFVGCTLPQHLESCKGRCYF